MNANYVFYSFKKNAKFGTPFILMYDLHIRYMESNLNFVISDNYSIVLSKHWMNHQKVPEGEQEFSTELIYFFSSWIITILWKTNVVHFVYIRFMKTQL